MERLSRWTDAAGGAAIALTLIGLAAGSAATHGGEAHEPLEATSAAAAFATPVPGSYALPPLGEATDGDVLTSEGEPIRLHALFETDANSFFHFGEAYRYTGRPEEAAAQYRKALTIDPDHGNASARLAEVTRG